MRKLFLAVALFIWFPQILSAQAGRVVLPCPANNQPYLTTRDSQDQLRQVICENLYNGSLSIQNAVLAGSACNGFTVICADIMFGLNWGAKVAAAFALLPARGGTVDARGLTGPDTITATIVMPPNSTLLMGKSQLYSSVTPWITYQYGDRILGMNPFADWFSTNLAGTVIWENGLAGVFTATNGNPPYAELGNFAVANQTAATSGTIVNTGVGIMMDGATNSYFHDLQCVGFVDCFVTDAYGNGTYYNSFSRLLASASTYASFIIGPITNSNTFDNLTLMPQVPAGPTYMANALLFLGGSGNTIGHLDIENFNDSLGVVMGVSGSATSSGTGGNTITWVSGQQFDSSGLWNGWGIQFNGSNYPITSCSSATVCTVTGNPDAHTNLAFYITNPGGGRTGGAQNSIMSAGDIEAGGTTSNISCAGTTTVTWTGGGKFMTGGIWASGWHTTINNGSPVDYYIASVTDPTHLVTTATCPTGTGVATTDWVPYYNSTPSYSSGNTVILMNQIYSWQGRPVFGNAGLNLTTGGATYGTDQSANLGSSGSPITLYSEPIAGDWSLYEVQYQFYGGGGAGNVVLNVQTGDEGGTYAQNITFTFANGRLSGSFFLGYFYGGSTISFWTVYTSPGVYHLRLRVVKRG